MPSIEPKNFAEGADLEFVVKIEVLPQKLLWLTMPALKSIALYLMLPMLTLIVMLETLRKQNAEWTAVERASADGDQVYNRFRWLLR